MTKEKTVLLNKDIITWDWCPDDSIDNTKLAASIVKSFASLGYKISKDSFEKLIHERNIDSFYMTVYPLLSEFKGADVNHVVFYKNFPDVPDLEEQFIHAILHYMFGVLPEDYSGEIEKPRLPLYEDVKLVELKIITPEESLKVLEKYFNECMLGKASWSESQKDTIKELYSSFSFKISQVPVNKENMCWLVANTSVNPKDVLKTATDVLRYITVLSDGDITLATNCKFRKFKRSERRTLLSIINNLNKHSGIEDMIKYRESWLRIGEILHPGEYSSQYPSAFDMFKKLRDNSEVVTFNRELEKLLANGDIVSASEHLKKRPGEFARKLDKLVRDAKVSEVKKVLDNFVEVSENISIPVLLQLRTHFISRKEKSSERVFILKGKRTRVKSIENKLEPLPDVLIDQVNQVILESIEKIISGREFMTPEDKVFIDPRMYNIAMPDNTMRSASDGKKMLTKGSKIKLDDDVKCLRFFTHWKNIPRSYGLYDYRVDIDLAVQIFDDNFKQVDELSWRNRDRSQKGVMAFSGDITDAPKGATEYIDISLGRLKDYKTIKNARYFVVTNNVFTGQSYNTIPECFSGVMCREAPNSGEIFEPSTVLSRADLCCEECGQMIAFVYDMDENCLIWIDSQLDHFNRVAGANTNLIANTVSNVLKKQSLTVGQFYEMYAKTHNILTDNIDEATFVVGRDVTEFDVESFSALL